MTEKTLAAIVLLLALVAGGVVAGGDIGGANAAEMSK
jgi:hypothetical protein